MAFVALTEVQAAYRAGFARWRDFRLALRRGEFPQPDVEFKDGPRWDEERLIKWLRKERTLTEQPSDAVLIERASRCVRP